MNIVCEEGRDTERDRDTETERLAETEREFMYLLLGSPHSLLGGFCFPQS